MTHTWLKQRAERSPTVYYIPLTEGSKVIELGYAADITDEFKERGMYDNLNEFMLTIFPVTEIFILYRRATMT